MVEVQGPPNLAPHGALRRIVVIDKCRVNEEDVEATFLEALPS
jgi:hypothetical protein